MKTILLILLVAFSAAAQAQRVYRCEDNQANVAYRDTPCQAPAASSGADQHGPYAPGTAPVPALALATLEAASPSDSEIGQPSARRVRAQQEGLLIGLRVQARQKPFDDRKAAQYAENHRRCESALRIAELCGKHAGKFYCDNQGFQPIPEAERVEPAVLDNSDKYQMERCAREAARAGP